ncbi:MAG: Ig-like domain-containing protein [Proteobacteria bacterium]|nr:Ig-like domain-containing protein [Pseudomonadota bacterium]
MQLKKRVCGDMSLVSIVLLVAFLAASSACDSGDAVDKGNLFAAGPGVVFSYPFAGQKDVPVGTRLIVGFTHPVDESALSGDCSAGSGAFCVVGPSGPLSNVAALAGPDQNIVQFQSPEFEPGTPYYVFIKPSLLLGVEPTNFPAEGDPLLWFRTRQNRSLAGERPTVIAINGDEPGAFIIGEGRAGSPRFPFMDYDGIRVGFSEPIDPTTALDGDTVELVEVDPGTGDTVAEVAGTLMVQGIHLSYDPDDDLTPGSHYRLRLSDGILDLSGESLVPGEFEFIPHDSGGTSGRLKQILNTQPAIGEDGSDSMSSVTGRPINVIEERSWLIGEQVVEFYDGNLEAEMADPKTFDTMLPIVIRKGALLRTNGIDIQLGGQIATGLYTGDISLRFLSDASGFLLRNPYRAEDQVPTDEDAPLFAFLVFDVALTATDATGNALLNQSVFSVQATGTATTIDGALSVQVTGATELDLLGIARAVVQLSLSLHSAPAQSIADDTEAPVLVASYPTDGQERFPARDRMLLTFSEPIDLARLGTGAIRLSTSGGTVLATHMVADGSTLILTPTAQLDRDREYMILLDGDIYDLSRPGNEFVSAPGDATSGDGRIVFRTAALDNTDATAPLFAAVYPGAPCALVEATAQSPGRCDDGPNDPKDDLYAPFELPADRPIEVYFDQPMDQSTLVLGTSCSTRGSISIEMLDGGGTCASAVVGTLTKRERSIRFVPTQPWIPGQAYRLTLRGGSNSNCDRNADEICSVHDRPLNSDPLDGTERNDGGGPDLDIRFVGMPAEDSLSYIPASTEPMTDINGNGLVDTTEARTDANRGAVNVTGVSGIVTRATVVDSPCPPEAGNLDQGCFYANASLPVAIGEPQVNCIVGQDSEGAPIVVDQCIPVEITPQIIYGTSLTIDTNLGTAETGRLLMRVRETPEKRNLAYIVNGNNGAELMLDLDVYLDAPDMSLPFDFLADHDLKSKQLSVSLKGPVSFTEDGRVKIELSNTADIDFTVNITAIGVSRIDMRLPGPVTPQGQPRPPGLKLQLLGQAPKNAMR